MDPLNLVISGSVKEPLGTMIEDLRKQGSTVDVLDRQPIDLKAHVDAVLIPVYADDPPDVSQRGFFAEYATPRVLLLTDNSLIGKYDPVSLHAQAMVFPPFHLIAIQNAIQTAIRIYSQHAVLEESLAHYVESHRHLGEGIILSDMRGTVRFANDLAKELLGLVDGDMYGLPIGDVFPIIDTEDDNPLRQLPDLTDKNGQIIKASRATVRGDDGQSMEVLFQVKSVGDGKKPDGMMLIFHEYRLRQKPKQVVTFKDDGKSSPVRNGNQDDDYVKHTVRIQTFSEFQISIDDEPIDIHRWRSKKALDALCLLLHSYGKPVQKDILIDFLWPETDASTGNRRLLNVISELRKYLEPNARRYSRNNFIRHESGMYRLSFEDHVYLDSALFRDLIRQGDYHWGVGEFRMARTYYQEALQHKNGVFMPRYMNSLLFDEAREQFEETEARIRQRLGFDNER
jgi:PAS domain-containing protein